MMWALQPERGSSFERIQEATGSCYSGKSPVGNHKIAEKSNGIRTAAA